MPVRITIWPSLKACHAKKRNIGRGTKHRWHHHPHMQLRTKGMHINDDIRRITHEPEASTLRALIDRPKHLPHFGLAHTLTDAQSVYFVIEIVPMIQRPPCPWDPALDTTSEVILHRCIFVQIAIRRLVHVTPLRWHDPRLRP